MQKLTDIDDFLSKLYSSKAFQAYKEQEVWSFFDHHPISNNEEIVKYKIYLLNRSYKTRVPKEDALKAICSLKGLDEKIEEGCSDAVSMIVNALEEVRGKKYYSFATKYCAMQNPKEFPIYDSVVAGIFETMLKRKMIIVDSIENTTKEPLKDYCNYKKIYDSFIQQFGVGKEHKYRGIDLYLWGGANEVFQKEIKKETQFMKYYNQK
ncbi:MAG: hypothetical protein IJU90_04985 [Bacteroidales bacterium]|nr:hypothetical protein [Bacteroidales bacterium]